MFEFYSVTLPKIPLRMIRKNYLLNRMFGVFDVFFFKYYADIFLAMFKKQRTINLTKIEGQFYENRLT